MRIIVPTKKAQEQGSVLTDNICPLFYGVQRATLYDVECPQQLHKSMLKCSSANFVASCRLSDVHANGQWQMC